MGAYSRWALIRGWALIRINTVCVNRFLSVITFLMGLSTEVSSSLGFN